MGGDLGPVAVGRDASVTKPKGKTRRGQWSAAITLTSEVEMREKVDSAAGLKLKLEHKVDVGVEGTTQE